MSIRRQQYPNIGSPCSRCGQPTRPSIVSQGGEREDCGTMMIMVSGALALVCWDCISPAEQARIGAWLAERIRQAAMRGE